MNGEQNIYPTSDGISGIDNNYQVFVARKGIDGKEKKMQSKKTFF